MRSVTVVTKASVFGDTTLDIELLDKGDVKAIVQESLAPVRQDLAEQDAKIADLNDKISGLKSEIGSLREEIKSRNADIAATVADLKKSLCSDFIKQCNEDIQGYFGKLIEYADRISRDAATLQSLQKTINEQYAVTTAIAQYFCECYKADLERREKELSQESERLAALASCLSQTQKPTD